MNRRSLKKYKVLWLAFALILSGALISCNEDYTPRDKDYPKINFPAKEYQTFDKDFCPFKFEYPVYAKIVQDTLYFDDKPEHPCWINMIYPEFGATVHMNYKDLEEKYSLNKLKEEVHRLTYKHAKRADYISPVEVYNDTLIGLIYQVGGDAASPIQFYVTDTTAHFMRGSLYFQTEPNIDSLRPVVNFIGEDIKHLVETLKWDY